MEEGKGGEKDMWGFGGRFYWGRKDSGKVEGIGVVFAWMSCQDKHLKNYVDLYSSLGWNSLLCHSQFLNLFLRVDGYINVINLWKMSEVELFGGRQDKAASLAREIVHELVQELKLRPCPIAFASFSGSPKACMYKVLQIVEGRGGEQINMELVRDCVSGNIFYSSPVDFVSDIGTQFVLHPTVLKMSHPPPLASWIASGISSTLDALFLSRFESQHAEFWQTLYSTVSIGAPYLILCSDDDDLAPIQMICNFASRLKDLGADVKLVKWNSSPHVGVL